MKVIQPHVAKYHCLYAQRAVALHMPGLFESSCVVLLTGRSMSKLARSSKASPNKTAKILLLNEWNEHCKLLLDILKSLNLQDSY